MNSKCLIRSVYHFYPDCERKKETRFFGARGFDWHEPLELFDSTESARNAISDHLSTPYRLAPGECRRPTLIITPVMRLPVEIREQMGCLP